MGYLRVYLGDKLTDQFELTGDRLTIGRAAESDLVLADPGVSRHHATITLENGKYFIEDNKSSNGVFLNKERIERAELNYWDEIQIYNYVLKFMAVQRRPTEIDRETAEADTRVDRTVVASVDDPEQLEKLRKQKKVAWVAETLKGGGEARHVLKSTFSVGSGGDCDVQIGGFFTPKLCASIERSGSSFQLVAHKRGNVSHNGKDLDAHTELQDGDHFQVRGTSFRFFNRVSET